MARIIDAFTQFFDDSGNPLVNGKLRFFESGTNNTDKDTFADSALTTPNTNPVILDGAGRCPNVFGSGVYNVISYTSDGVQIQQFDPVGANAGTGAFDSWAATNIYGEGDIVELDGEYYRSITDDNQNNNPGSSPANWELLKLGRVYNANVTYAQFDSAYGSDGKLYVSQVAANLNNDPVTDDGTNWKTTAKMDAGTAIGDLVQLEDAGGDPALPAVDGSQLIGVGVVNQVVTPSPKTNTFSTTSTSFVAVTGLSVSVTADDATDRVLIRAMINGDTSAANGVMRLQIYKDGSVISQGDAAGSRTQVISTLLRGTASEETHLSNAFIEVLDTAGDTNPHTYQVYISMNSGTGYINRTATDTDNASYSRGISSITAEVLSA